MQTFEVLKYIERCNFRTIAMYIIVYISGRELSQIIHFWHHILLTIHIFEKIGKKQKGVQIDKIYYCLFVCLRKCLFVSWRVCLFVRLFAHLLGSITINVSDLHIQSGYARRF